MKTMIVFLLLFVSAGLWAQTEEEQATLVKTGQQVPDFVLEGSDGQPISMKDLRGKVVLINFFATWCGPCMKELPHVQKEIYEKYKDNPDLRLLVIGREHTWDDLNQFKEKKGFGFDLFPDPKRTVYSKFASRFIPRNFIVGKDGKIVYASVGFEGKEFRKMLDVLKEQLAL